MSNSSFPLDTLNLSQPHIAACNRAGLLHASEVLLPAASDLNKKLKFSRQENVHDLVKTVSKAIVPEPLSFAGLIEEDVGEEHRGKDGNWVSTGDLGIDSALGGGLRAGTITELTGESAAGKSHFCLSLAIAAQIPALTAKPGGAMFLTSEREIATARLYELADHFLATHDPRGLLDADDLLDNVLSNIVTDITLLEHTLMYKVPFILRQRAGRGPARLLGQEGEEEGGEGKPIRVIIIDSITALIRGADSTYANSSSIGLAERSRYLCAVSDRLKALAVEFNLAVVVINQVSDVFTRAPALPSTPTNPPSTQQMSQFYTDGPEPPMLYATQSRWFSGQTETLKKEASLGIVWANAVNTRIMLSRTGRRRMVDPRDLSKRPKRRKEDLEEGEAPSSGVNGAGPVVDDTAPMLIRRAHVVFCPFAPTATIDYIISPTGVHSIPDSYRLIDIAQTVRRRRRMAKAILGLDDDENEQNGLVVPTSDPPSQLSQVSERVGESRGKGDDEVFDEFGDEVFDDFGDLPAEFWEGKLDQSGG